MADSIAITLLRHAITEANKEKRYLGWTDVPLAEEARRKYAGLSCFGRQFDWCVTSDLIRTKQTADLLCPQLARMESSCFREMNFGDWEMKTYEELKTNSLYRSWLSSPEVHTPPGGENFTEMKMRIEAGFQVMKSEIDRRGSRSILLITHGGVIRYLLMKYAPERKQFFDWKVPHDVAYRLHWEKADWKDGKRCTLLQEVPLTAKENG